MANQSIFAAFERMWQHIVTALDKKSDISHTHTVEDMTDFTEQIETKLLDNQADWSINDENSPAYVKNRTHYEDVEFIEIVPEQSVTKGEGNVHVTASVVPVIGKEYTVLVNGQKHKIEAKSVLNSPPVFVGIGNASFASPVENTGEPIFCMYTGTDFQVYWDSSLGETITLAIYEEQGSVVQLDEKFIPDTIARKEYVDDIVANISIDVDSELSDTSENPVQNKVVNTAINNLHTLIGDTSVSEQINTALMDSQADFTETDESSPSFIKNKPTEEDAMELLAEMDIVQPMADENGALYVDENNTIYVI